MYGRVMITSEMTEITHVCTRKYNGMGASILLF